MNFMFKVLDVLFLGGWMLLMLLESSLCRPTNKSNAFLSFFIN
jgi:hypothetical protein